ncbi:MAG TPA: hypothetical protein VN918_00805 [Myxococcaceae bacterium]|nr:hypothetical protein [Myxococcaceae bacterium]
MTGESYLKLRSEQMASLLEQANNPGETLTRREQAGRAYRDWRELGPWIRRVTELMASYRY